MGKRLLGSAALALMSAAAMAAVDYDPATGGFVGKGDVQLAFGWNNPQLQANAAGITFSYTVSTRYAITCEWYTGPEHNRHRHEVTQKKSFGVDATVAHEARRANQITGFDLSPVGAGAGAGAPAVGQPCLGQGTGGTIIEVEMLEAGEGSGLTVHYEGQSVPLPNTL